MDSLSRRLLLFDNAVSGLVRRTAPGLFITIRQDIPYFKKLGLFGLATQYAENFGSNGLVYYVAATGEGELPGKVSLWVVGHDFDAGWKDSECDVWTIGPEGGRS